MHIDLTAIWSYAKEKGTKPIELSDEEIEMFVIGLRPFNQSCFRLLKSGRCYNCGEETTYLARSHGVYVCNDDCLEMLDQRYENGEDFAPEKIW